MPPAITWQRLLPLPPQLDPAFLAWLLPYIESRVAPGDDPDRLLLAARLAQALARLHWAAARLADTPADQPPLAIWLRVEAQATRALAATERDLANHTRLTTISANRLAAQAARSNAATPAPATPSPAPAPTPTTPPPTKTLPTKPLRREPSAFQQIRRDLKASGLPDDWLDDLLTPSNPANTRHASVPIPIAASP